MAKVLGIDLGTTNSVVAIMEAGEPTVLENAEGSRLTPSVVAVNPKTGERLVGQVARRQAITNPENTIFSVKRFMGRKFEDAEVQKALKIVPYKVAKASNGDTCLGGDDFDQRVIDWIVDEFKKDQGIDLRQDRMALQRLKEAAEKAKIELSSTQTTEINLPFITADAGGPKHLSLNLSRAKLEQLVGDLVERTKGPVQQALKDAGISPSDVDEVVLVGGQTRMPAVQEMVKQVFGKEPHKGVNPDEVVAIGAAIQAGVLKGEVKDILLLDVTPLTLGVETYGGVMTPMIPRNTTIPTSKTETYTTAADAQTSVEVHIMQGERPMATENKSLGRFILDGILPAPRGVPQVEVTFDIDANGILNVSAKDKATAKEQKIVIQSSSGLSDAEIQKMVKDAEEHAADDARRREEIEIRNHADSAHYQAEKMLREQGDKMPEQLRTQVAEKSSAVKRALDANDTEGMKTAMEELQQAMMAVGQAVYGAGEGAAPSEPSEPGANGQGGPGSPSGTVEGEYREV